jgi:ABC-type multidrug transport system ATPase subunit
MSEIVLQTEELRKQFGGPRGVVAVDGVNLSVRRGEVFGFLGPNGAGKTTAIGMLLGLLRPTSGRVALFGQPVTPSHVAPLRRVGSLVGAPAMIPRFTALENLHVLARLHPNVDARRVDEVLEVVGLTETSNRLVKGFSLGMKQRLGLALALLHRPELLILDEPTNGLDPAGMREIRELLQALAKAGVTVFLSSHLLHEIEQVCDRVAVLRRGRVVAQGEVSLLLGDQAVVRARVPDPAAAARALRHLEGVTEIDSNGNYVHVKGPSSEAVNFHLVQHSIIPSELTSDRPDLESAFLELTR